MEDTNSSSMLLPIPCLPTEEPLSDHFLPSSSAYKQPMSQYQAPVYQQSKYKRSANYYAAPAKQMYQAPS